MVFLEYQACPFNRGGMGWLFGSWMVFQETSRSLAEAIIARTARRNGSLNRAQESMTRCKSAETPEVCESICEAVCGFPKESHDFCRFKPCSAHHSLLPAEEARRIRFIFNSLRMTAMI
jgi:hypothetical protein